MKPTKTIDKATALSLDFILVDWHWLKERMRVANADMARFKRRLDELGAIYFEVDRETSYPSEMGRIACSEEDAKAAVNLDIIFLSSFVYVYSY